MTDPKRGQTTPEKSGRQTEDQGRKPEKEREGEHDPMPSKKGDSGSSRETRQM